MKKKNHVKSQRIFNLIILDESGSMQTIERQAVSGLNETFQTIINAQKENHDVDVSKKLKWKDYEPDDCTPLFDAMGRSINELRKCVEENDVVLVTIITDGYENASRNYSGREIKRLVGELREKGWVFAYIGTNQDVDAVADDMGIRSRMYYDYSDRGACVMFEAERSSKRNFFARLHREGRSFLFDDDYDYFHPGNEDAVKQDKEPEKRPDIVWDMKEEEKQQESPESEETVEEAEKTAEEPEGPKGFFGKLKDYIFG